MIVIFERENKRRIGAANSRVRRPYGRRPKAEARFASLGKTGKKKNTLIE